jgi:two-component system nitrogen regulation response regulator GlnG
MEIAVATSGKDGLKEITEKPADVVLLDLSMPDLSGLEVYTRLREIDARIPVIFITATSTESENDHRGDAPGAYDYLFKPVDLRQLDKVVTEAVELSRRMRARPINEHLRTKPPVMPSLALTRDAEVYKAIGRR